MEIIDLLLQLKKVLAEREGEILSITLNKKGIDALNVELQIFHSHCCVGVCPTCNRVTSNMVLGIRVIKSSVVPQQMDKKATGE